MNFNPLEFTNTVNHNQYYPPLLEYPSSLTLDSSSSISNEALIVNNDNVADTSNSFFSTSNFLKKLASGTLFTGRSSIYSSPMQQSQNSQHSQQQQQQQHQQHSNLQHKQQQQNNNLTDTIKKSLIFGASNTILNTNNSIILPIASTTTGSNNIILPQDYLTNSVILNASTFSEEAYQRQIEYDKFMNEIWVGIVLTLIIISMIFCICSCFLYHQFRLWKANYRNSVRQQQNQDIESVKFNLEDDDPVPQYTLVSGLPTYEAALDMLKKLPILQQQLSGEQQQQQKLNNYNCKYQATPTKIYPSVFSIFTKNEKSTSGTTIESSSENNNNNNNNNNTTPSTLITINESIRKSLLNIEKLPSTSTSEVELKPLVNNSTTNSCSTSNSEMITTNTNTTRTTSSSTTSTDENYGNFELLSYNVMHRNNTCDNLTIIKSSPTSSQIFENIEGTNDMIDSDESSSIASSCSDDEDDNNCEKLENHEETPLKKHHLHP